MSLSLILFQFLYFGSFLVNCRQGVRDCECAAWIRALKGKNKNLVSFIKRKNLWSLYSKFWSELNFSIFFSIKNPTTKQIQQKTRQIHINLRRTTGKRLSKNILDW